MSDDYALLKGIEEQFGSPVYVYSEEILQRQVNAALNFPNPFGITVRFAMKACPNAAILRLFHSWGVNFDCSSAYEVKRAMMAGIPASHLSLSSQELPALALKTHVYDGGLTFDEIINNGVHFNACSCHQLETFGKRFPGGSCGIRFNPGTGSGGTGKTNVGGTSASFGIWHEYIPQVKQIVDQYRLNIIRIHTHIGSGSDPVIWSNVVGMSLALVEHFPDACILNLGGGFKVGRMPYEKTTDLQVIGLPMKHQLEEFAKRTSRQLKLEIEPGTYLVAAAGRLLCSVQDIVSTKSPAGTKESGYDFLKLNAGMNDVLRPSLYGAQHPITIHRPSEDSTSDLKDYVVVGHCCESGDLFSCGIGEPEELLPRKLPAAHIGDLATIDYTGAYCSAMATKNYNSFPESAEVIVDRNNIPHLIRRRQNLDQIIENETPYELK